jgi:hypothetical protein
MENTDNSTMKPLDYANKLKQALSDITFPATKRDIITRKGATQVEVSAGKRVSVGQALGPVAQERFTDSAEVLRQVSEAHHLNWPTTEP